MQQLTLEDVKSLAEFEGDPCISIYLPTQRRAGRSLKQDAQRLRHGLEWAHDRAAVLAGRDSKALMDFFKEATELTSDNSFWQERSEGLAMFLAPGFTRIYHLPEEFLESVSVGRHFNVTPLLQVAQSQSLLVLALSQNHAQLWKVNNQLAVPVEVKDMPASLAKVQRFKEPEKLENRHVAGGPGSYHGEGDDTRMARSELVEYVQAVDKALNNQLKNNRLPLVLLGAEPTVGTYRQQSRYPAILPEAIRCNPDTVKAQEICSEVLPILKKLIEQQLEKTKAHYSNLEATEPHRVSSSITDIFKASGEGRVDSLMVAYGSGLNSSEVFREHLGAEEVLSDVNEDLLNAAVRSTLLSGGAVIPVDQAEFPANSKIAAIMRY